MQIKHVEAIAGTELTYLSAKAYVNMCERGYGYKGYYSVHPQAKAIVGYLNDAIISFILYDVEPEYKTIHILSAYTIPELRHRGHYLELFTEFKRYRDRQYSEYVIQSEILTGNSKNMEKIVNKTGRVKVSEIWEC